MGLFKDILSPNRAEKERYERLLKEKRVEYPKMSFNMTDYSRLSPAEKIKRCQDLTSKVAELRLLKAGKIEDSMLSDGHRVDERGKKVYTTIFDEYVGVYKMMFCDPILQAVTVNQDRVDTLKEVDDLQARIEKDTDAQRTIIIGVGGLVLLIGTIIILRKL